MAVNRHCCSISDRLVRFRVAKETFCPPKRDTLSLISATSKKSPNVYKICTKMISLVKLKIFTPLHKLPKNVGDLGKLIVVKAFEKLPKIQ